MSVGKQVICDYHKSRKSKSYNVMCSDIVQIYRLTWFQLRLSNFSFVVALSILQMREEYNIDRKLPVMTQSTRATVLWTRWLGLLYKWALILGITEFADTALSRELTFLHELETDVPDSCYYNSGSWYGCTTTFNLHLNRKVLEK